ncbi:hypothetical protein PsorP6_013928 [Peronosclerospora sorghi]|uniref:Uncharacterized protein n=1 Tax=Peronosclerospora sorghi TaxID=230839 RepID=A0ACC0VHM5_9STRA|nr:hypothetical protein PsorP6_013928 [Peronosclerospora sorghi]
MRSDCTVPTSRTLRLRKQQALTSKDKLHISVKLWTLRLDLEESLGDMDSTRAGYDQVFELKIITPKMVLNFASYLEENTYFEELLRLHERGLGSMATYLRKLVQRYAGKQMERTRDLFEQAIRAVPAKSVRKFYENFADFGEQNSMLRNVMTIYERASNAVQDDEKLAVYDVYIKKAQTFFGVERYGMCTNVA